MAITLTKLSSRKPEQLEVESTANHDFEIPKKICATCSTDKKDRAQSKAKRLTRRSAG